MSWTCELLNPPHSVYSLLYAIIIPAEAFRLLLAWSHSLFSPIKNVVARLDMVPGPKKHISNEGPAVCIRSILFGVDLIPLHCLGLGQGVYIQASGNWLAILSC